MLRFIKSNIIIGLTIVMFLATFFIANWTNADQLPGRLIASRSQENSTNTGNNRNSSNLNNIDPYSDKEKGDKENNDKEESDKEEDDNKKTQQTTISPDAIAVRVFNNNQHLSPYDWYQSNISAYRSLQSLIIDGYDAVRDNRTVYVATTNIVESKLVPITVVISFNQDISNETMDIFGQILNNWRFNQNINYDDGFCLSEPGQQSVIICQSDKDCASGQYCSNKKSKIIRDTKRLIQLTSLNKQLAEYYNSYHERYPSLETGTYLPNKTLSTWPSWQQALAVKLGTSLPIDPVNKLGPCNGYHPVTCWNEQTKSFVTGDSWPDLPNGSLVYQYELINDKSYLLCANFETDYSNLESLQCNNGFTNSPPVVTCSELRGIINQPFVGYVNVHDPDGDNINSIIGISMAQTTSNWGPLTAVLTNNRQQIKITSPYVNTDGNFTIHLQVKDSFDNTASVSCPVSIADYCPNRFSINYVATSGGSIDGQSLQYVCQGDNGETVVAKPSLGYSFVNWSDHVEQATRKELNVIKNQTITANFAVSKHTIHFDPQGGTNLEFTNKPVTYNQPVGKLPNVDKANYVYTWNTNPDGSGVTYTADTIYEIDKDLNLYAIWSPAYYNLTYRVNPVDGGSIAGNSNQQVLVGGQGTPVEVIAANDNYQFTHWSDGQTNPTRQDSNITQDMTITAYFNNNTCGQFTVTDIDGFIYSTVSIGDQCWLGENLKTINFRNGDNIPFGKTKILSPGYSYYQNNPDYYNQYGALYNHYAVRDSRGICPTGWRVPNGADIESLRVYLSNDNNGVNIGRVLKSTTWNGSDKYGFSALPAGYNETVAHNNELQPQYLGFQSYLQINSRFTDKTKNLTTIYGLKLSNDPNYFEISRNLSLQDYLSVRCLRGPDDPHDYSYGGDGGGTIPGEDIPGAGQEGGL